VIENYRHTQIGTLILGILGVFFVLMAAVWLPARAPLSFTLMLLAFLLLVAALSGWMTVRVGAGRLQWRLGIGLIGGSARLEDIEEVRIVRNPWYYGWGMHLTQHGWLYNVSGLDGVEVKLSSGKRFRLGTDEPQRLVEALDMAR